MGERLDQMWFPSAAKGGADTVLQFLGGEQPRWLRHPLLARQPLGLDGVEPGTLGGQVADDQPHALAGLLDLTIVLAQPGAHDLAVVPGGVIPSQISNTARLPWAWASWAHQRRKSMVTALTGRPSTKRSHRSSLRCPWASQERAKRP